MAETTTELLRYTSITKYHPKIGDMVIKHGIFQRTKWFGVINYVTPDGKNIHLIKDGCVRLLATIPEHKREAHSIIIGLSEIYDAWAGTYSILQQDNLTQVWYI